MMERTDQERETGPADGATAAAADAERLRRELGEEQRRLLRLLADFENLRRRVTRDQQAARHEGQRAALLPLLAVLDTLERALAAGSRDADFYEGVAATRRLFVDALREAGAEPTESVNRPFDPTAHEAVATEPADVVAPGTVVRELRRGWRLGDEILRPAQVVVATATRESDDAWQ
jgi:molecular chaperone GrpE